MITHLSPLSGLAGLQVQNLRCEYRENPLGIDERQPRLTWIIESKKRGQKQSAYQILVASSVKLLARNSGDLRDSGQVASDRTANIVYAGMGVFSKNVMWATCRI